jgi:hypothetical protein
MYTRLAVIAVSGFAVSAICLGGAFALGGSAIGDKILDIGDFGQPRCDTSGPSTAATSRTLRWDGNGDRAAVAVVANTYYRAGSGEQLVVKGDPRIISHIYVRDGVVGIDCRTGGFFHNKAERIEVTLPGRNFRAFEQLGSGDMRLAELSQPEARISVEGSGSIEANGKIDRLKAVIAGSGNLAVTGNADSLDLTVEGSGDAKLSELVVKNADVIIEGSGDAEIAPQGASHVAITGEGSGDVTAAGTANMLSESTVPATSRCAMSRKSSTHRSRGAGTSPILMARARTGIRNSAMPGWSRMISAPSLTMPWREAVRPIRMNWTAPRLS